MKYLWVIVITVAINCVIPLSYANDQKAHSSAKMQLADCGCKSGDKRKYCNKS